MHVAPAMSSPAAEGARGSRPERDLNAEAFASVFAQAARGVAQPIERRTGLGETLAAGSRRQERLAETLAESDRRDALTGTSHPESTSGSRRVDRLRDAGRASQQREEALTSRSDSRQADAGAAKAARDRSDLKSSVPHETAASNESPRTVEAAGARADSVAGSASAREPAPTTRGSAASPDGHARADSPSGLPSPPAAHPGAGVVSSSQAPGGPTASGANVAVASPAPVGGTPPQPDGGSLRDASTLLYAAKGTSPAAQSTAPGAEFQHAFGTAQRARDAAGEAPAARAAAPADKTAQDFNLSESKSADELARVIHTSIGSKRSNMTLRLDPPELGRLRVDVRMADEAMTVRFEADTPAGQEAIRGRLTELRDALERHGIHINQMEVELRPPAPTRHDLQGNASPHRGDANAGQGFAQPPPQDGGSSSHGQSGSPAPPEWESGQSTFQPDPWHDAPAEGPLSIQTGVDLVA